MGERPIIYVQIAAASEEEFVRAAAKQFRGDVFVATDAPTARDIRVEARFGSGPLGVRADAIATPTTHNGAKGILVRLVKLAPNSVAVPIWDPAAPPTPSPMSATLAQSATPAKHVVPATARTASKHVISTRPPTPTPVIDDVEEFGAAITNTSNVSADIAKTLHDTVTPAGGVATPAEPAEPRAHAKLVRRTPPVSVQFEPPKPVVKSIPLAPEPSLDQEWGSDEPTARPTPPVRKSETPKPATTPPSPVASIGARVVETPPRGAPQFSPPRPAAPALDDDTALDIAFDALDDADLVIRVEKPIATPLAPPSIPSKSTTAKQSPAAPSESKPATGTSSKSDASGGLAKPTSGATGALSSKSDGSGGLAKPTAGAAPISAKSNAPKPASGATGASSKSDGSGGLGKPTTSSATGASSKSDGSGGLAKPTAGAAPISAKSNVPRPSSGASSSKSDGSGGLAKPTPSGAIGASSSKSDGSGGLAKPTAGAAPISAKSNDPRSSSGFGSTTAASTNAAPVFLAKGAPSGVAVKPTNSAPSSPAKPTTSSLSTPPPPADGIEGSSAPRFAESPADGETTPATSTFVATGGTENTRPTGRASRDSLEEAASATAASEAHSLATSEIGPVDRPTSVGIVASSRVSTEAIDSPRTRTWMMVGLGFMGVLAVVIVVVIATRGGGSKEGKAGNEGKEGKQGSDSALRNVEIEKHLATAAARIQDGKLVGADGDTALDHLLKAKRLAPSDKQVLAQLGMLASTFEKLGDGAAAAGDLGEAATHFQAALSAEPDRVSASKKLKAVEDRARGGSR